MKKGETKAFPFPPGQPSKYTERQRIVNGRKETPEIKGL